MRLQSVKAHNVLILEISIGPKTVTLTIFVKIMNGIFILYKISTPSKEKSFTTKAVSKQMTHPSTSTA